MLAHVVPLALVAAISPALLGASVEVLIAFGPRGRRMLLGYLLGAAVVVIAFLAAASALPQRATRGGALLVDAVDAVLAVVLLALAAVLAFRRPRPTSGPGRLQALLRSRWAAPGVVGLGALMMVTNISTLTVVVAGAHEAASSGGVTVGAAWTVLALGALAPILLPLLWAAVGRAAATRQLTLLDAVIARRGRVIGIVVCVLTACYLIARATGVL
jgi:hypothetical protein